MRENFEYIALRRIDIPGSVGLLAYPEGGEVSASRAA